MKISPLSAKICITVRRSEDAAVLGPVPASPAELSTLVDL